MEGRKGENVVHALGSYEGEDPSCSSGDAGKGAQPLCPSVCAAASLLGYSYSPCEHLIFESSLSRSKWI